MKSEPIDLDALEQGAHDKRDYLVGMERYIPALVAELRASRRVVEAAQAYLDDILRLDNVSEDHLIQVIDAGATQWNLEEALADLQHKDG